MTKKSKIVTSKYVTSSNTDASKWLNISVIIATLFIFQIIYFGLSVTVAIICTLIAILIILHVVIKFSAIFKLESKIAFKADTNYLPFVSIHIACKSEPAEIVNKTVKAMTELDYPNYEVIVINSNSIDKENWYKIQKYVESCGDNYKFVHLDTVDGFKAGALNYLNDNNVNAEVEVIAIVDSDYIVKPDFLKIQSTEYIRTLIKNSIS